MPRRLWVQIAVSQVLLVSLTTGLVGVVLAKNAADWTLTLLVGLLVSLLALMLAARFARRLDEPLEQTREAITRFGGGDLDARPPILEDEQQTAGLARDFSVMADRLASEMRAGSLERSRMSAVFEQMHDSIVLTDSTGRVGSINRAAARLFSTTPEEAIGRSFIEVTHDYELHNALRAVLLDPDQSQSIDVRVGGREASALVSAVPDPGGGPASGLVVLQDVTEVRHLERVRRDFVANIGHELRTPLASIKLLAETLHSAIQDDPNGATEFLERIDVEVDGLTGLVRELEELSRIESRQVGLHPVAVDPCELLERAASRMRAHAERAGLTLSTSCQDGLPPAWADAGRIEQVLVNLLHNAIKATPPGGTVILSAEPDDNQQMLVISVADTGTGIMPDDVPRIFERFYKVDKARTGERGSEAGSGLGLSIAKHLVQAHGGRIWAESQYGEGAVFFFTLPIITAR